MTFGEPGRSSDAAGISRYRHTWLLIAACVGIAVWFAIFHPVILGMQRYGNLPAHQIYCLALLNPSLNDASAELPDRLQHLVDYDYHLLIEPDLEAILDAWRNGRVPLVDPGRCLGIPLWGSVIADFGNPLNPIFCWMDAGAAHLGKLLVYFAVGWAGMAYLLCRVFERTLLAGLAGSAIFFLNPYHFFFLHCANFAGVMAFFPWLLSFLLRLLAGRGRTACAGFSVALAGMILCNFAQLTVYCGLFCGVATTAFLAVKRAEWRKMIPRLGALILSAASGVSFTWFAVGPILETTAAMARDGTPFNSKFYPYLGMPDLGAVTNGAFLPIPHLRGEFWREPFFPAPFLFLALLGLISMRSMPRPVFLASVSVAIFYMIYFFVGWIDYPLWLLAGKLYAPNPLQLRGLAALYILFAGLVSMGWDAFFGFSGPKRIARACAAGLALLASLLALAIWCGPASAIPPIYTSNPFTSSQASQPGFWLFLASCAGACILFFSGKPLPALMALIISGVAYGSTRIAFYEPSRALTRRAADPGERELEPRVTRGIDTDAVRAIPDRSDHRQLHDAVFATLGLTGFTGYHTSMSRRELAIYDLFAGDDYLGSDGVQGLRDSENFRDYRLGYFHSFLFRDQVMRGGEWDPKQRLRLKLLGVSKITPKVLLGSPLESAGDLTGADKPVHLLPGATTQAVKLLFASDEPAGPSRFDPVGLSCRFDTRSGTYSIALAGKGGTVIFPYNLGSRFRCEIDGRPAKASPDPDFAFWLIQVGETDAKIEFIPDETSLLSPAVAGIGIGLALLFAARKCAGARADQRIPAS